MASFVRKILCILFLKLYIIDCASAMDDKVVDLSGHSKSFKRILMELGEKGTKMDPQNDGMLELISESASSATIENASINENYNKVLACNDSGEPPLISEQNDKRKSDRLSQSSMDMSATGTVLPSQEVGQRTPLPKNNIDDVNETIKLSKYSSEILTPQNLLQIVPPFDQNWEGISKECRLQSKIYLEELKKMKLWALKMYDASAKIPSGFLNGNINQYGDLDQCLEVDSGDIEGIKGKYCLTSLQVTLSQNATPIEGEIFDMIHSHHAFRSNLRDPGHRVPRFSSINWALCVPSQCSSADVQKSLERMLSGHTTVSTEVLVEPQMCQVAGDGNIPRGTIIVGLIFVSFIVLALLATFLELTYKENTSNVILSFSVYKNMKSLFSLRRSDDDVESVHGIRCINAILLLIAHKSMAMFFEPFMNRTTMAQSLGQPWSVIGRAASLYTDPFIMFSGLLTCYSFAGKTKRGQDISLTQEYLGRLFRLVPTLGALILFCTWILPEIGSGPQWPLVVSHHAHICKHNWWRNLLFVHNYFGFENMCLTHTHHIGIDTQLFVFGVPLAIWLTKYPNQRTLSISVLAALALLSTLARFYVSYTMELANFVFFGTSVDQLFRTANYMYILPAHRFTVYAMGLYLGLLLRQTPIPGKRLTRGQLELGWLMCGGCFVLSFLAPAGMGRIGYQYSAFSAASYAAFAPVGWCAGFAWIIYTQHHGYNSLLGKGFSLPYFSVWTRLSYAIYLTQFPVYFYYVGSMRTPVHYSFPGHYINVKEYAVIGVYSIILTLLFDLPFQNIKKIIFSPRQKTVVTKEVSNKEQNYNTMFSEAKKYPEMGQSVAIVERNSERKWKAD